MNKINLKTIKYKLEELKNNSRYSSLNKQKIEKLFNDVVLHSQIIFEYGDCFDLLEKKLFSFEIFIKNNKYSYPKHKDKNFIKDLKDFTDKELNFEYFENLSVKSFNIMKKIDIDLNQEKENGKYRNFARNKKYLGYSLLFGFITFYYTKGQNRKVESLILNVVKNWLEEDLFELFIKNKNKNKKIDKTGEDKDRVLSFRFSSIPDFRINNKKIEYQVSNRLTSIPLKINKLNSCKYNSSIVIGKINGDNTEYFIMDNKFLKNISKNFEIKEIYPGEKKKGYVIPFSKMKKLDLEKFIS